MIASTHDNEKDRATVTYWPDAHDGPGWYYVDDEYKDEGSVGAFATKEEAVAHAEAAGYTVTVTVAEGVL